MIRATTTPTPDGPFTVVTDDVAVLASGWTEDLGSLIDLIHPELRPRIDDVDLTGTPSPSSTLERAAEAVIAYYDGDLTAPDRIAVLQRSGPFRHHAWDVLRGVTPGERITYTQYAARAGRPAAVRAAAGACAMNAAALFVPCHRVLRTDGTLGGFRYGLGVKASLLDRETTASHPTVAS